MAKPRRTYPTPLLTTSVKLARVHQAHQDVRAREQEIAAMEQARAAGTTTWGLGDPIDRALATARASLDSHRQLLARLEAEYGPLETLREQHRGESTVSPSC